MHKRIGVLNIGRSRNSQRRRKMGEGGGGGAVILEQSGDNRASIALTIWCRSRAVVV